MEWNESDLGNGKRYAKNVDSDEAVLSGGFRKGGGSLPLTCALKLPASECIRLNTFHYAQSK